MYTKEVKYRKKFNKNNKSIDKNKIKCKSSNKEEFPYQTESGTLKIIG